MNTLFAKFRKLPCVKENRLTLVHNPDPNLLYFSISGDYHRFQVLLNRTTKKYSIQQQGYASYNRKLVVDNAEFKSVDSFLKVLLEFLNR